jgi:REP element-mobilizing transposase RayT
MKDFYLLTTEHLESCLWFRDEEDFKVAMNYVAIQAACCPEVSVLAFILMSNHVHFVLRGNREDVQLFIDKYKCRYSLYFQKKNGIRELLRRNMVDIRIVPLFDDSLERTIAYVQMNCVAANICSHPSQYRWGTGNVYFMQNKTTCKRIGDLSVRSKKLMLHSECVLIPDEWQITEGGYVNPLSYVDYQTVEKVFRTPKRMNYYLFSSSKARKRIETTEGLLPAFRDQTILAALPDLCRSLFQKESFASLQAAEQTELARQIRFRFSADANQIARVCGISYASAARLLDKE